MPPLIFRKATAGDLEPILDLFRQTITHVNAKDYTPEQINAWTSSLRKPERWLKKIKEQYFLLASLPHQLAGFGSLTDEGYLDFLFVHKDHQRRGVASALYQALELRAKSLQLTAITTDASLTAQSFFEKQGFESLTQQKVWIGNVMLTNFKMKKVLV